MEPRRSSSIPISREFNGPPPPGSHSIPGDTRRVYKWGDVATSDVAVIDAHIQRADFVLVTHTHYDHVLDVPHIALKTGATVIGTESTENVMRAYGVPEGQLITVRGGRTTSSAPSRSKSFPAFTALWTTSATLAPRPPRLE